jgi:hypothetical protein
MVEKAGFIVAFCARGLAMTGGSPGFQINIHLMAETAEGRGL